MNRAAFFAGVRTPVFGGSLTASQVAGTECLLTAMEVARWPLAHAAYGLATAFHETAATMQPIAEYGRGKGKAYGKPAKYSKAPYGRGYVQLTWDLNYEKVDRELGLGGRLLADFDMAMRPEIAAPIMVRGMAEGWFTGKANRTYLDKSPPDYVEARRIINGTDDAALIAGYAHKFEAALRAGGYGVPVPIAWNDATVITHGGVALPKPAERAPLPPPPDIDLAPLPQAPDRVGIWRAFLAFFTARLKGQ